MSATPEGSSSSNGQIPDARYTTTHELDRSLPDGFPHPRLTPRDPSEYQHIGPEGWTGYWPPEDSAIPPDVDWTEAHRILVLAAYQKKWGRFLEDNETYEVTWPPEAALWTEGHVYEGEVCASHEDADCHECDEFTTVASEIEPAEWQWRVTVETYAWTGKTGSLEDRSDFHFVTSFMDPRDVDYSW